MIDELRQLRDANRDQGDAIQRQINYLTANLARMKYQQYRQAHLPIGSGTVESACKNVVAAPDEGQWHDLDPGWGRGTCCSYARQS